MDAPGSNGPATLQGNTKEVYAGKPKKKSKFNKIARMLGK